MTPEKRARLEAAGWKVGDTSEFLGTPPVPLTVERLTELARIFNKETQEYTSEMSRHAVRDFAKWLASRLIPQPEEKR